jgi:hypothetical protein
MGAFFAVVFFTAVFFTAFFLLAIFRYAFRSASCCRRILRRC